MTGLYVREIMWRFRQPPLGTVVPAIWLGGSSGSTGGTGGPPGGFVGLLPQTAICFDTTMAASSSGSTTLLDNLNRIRQSIVDISTSGSLGHIIHNDSGALTQRPKLKFTGDGVVVSDSPGDDATLVTITTGSSAGASTFLELTDVPSDYTGYGGYLLAVNGGETGVEFIAQSSAQAGHVIYNNSGSFVQRTRLRFLGNVSVADNDPYTDVTITSGSPAFTNLSDTPSSYSGSGGYVVAVNSGATGLEFVASSAGAVSKLDGWITDSDVSASGVSTVELGELPAYSIVTNVFVYVHEAGSGDWDYITVGYDGATTAYVSSQGVGSTGTALQLFMMNEGVGAFSDPGIEHFTMVQSAKTVKIYTNSLSGSGPTAGKVYVAVLYITGSAPPS